jgi:hypothetical protein
MMNSVKSCWLALPLLVLSLQSGLAQAPSGIVNFSFNSSSTAVYDLSGIYELDQDIIGSGGTATPLAITGMPLTHTHSGHLQGSGWITVTIGDSAVAAFYNASGRVSGGAGNPARVHLTVRLHGKDTVAGILTGFSISVSYDLEVDPATMSLLGSARGHASFTKFPGGSVTSDSMAVPLPAGVDGTWSAQLDVVPLGHLVGTGEIVLSNGRILPVRLSGSFSGTTGLSKVHLSGYRSGDNDGRSTSLRMNFFTDAPQPDFLSGTMLGQKVIQ